MSTLTNHTLSADELHRMLVRWQGEGLLDATEVDRIEAVEAARAETPEPPSQPGPGGGSLIGEALGYAGAALITAAAIVLITRDWARLAFAAQVAITGGAAAVFLAAGFLVPARMADPGRRLRAVLWVGSTAMAFATWLLVSGKDGFDWSNRAMLVFAAALASVQAGLLWWRSRALPQHLATFAALALLIVGACRYVPGMGDRPAGALGVLALGAVWVVLARFDIVHPQVVASLVGAFVAVTAAQFTTDWTWGAVLVLAVAAGFIGFAVWQRSLPILGIGTYAALMGVPAAVDKLFPGSTNIAFGLMFTGVVLVASALWITRRHKAAAPG
jgi:uncharacterized membrane protein